MPAPQAMELTDPRAMRALAHPLRLRILRLLQHDGPATATTVARACGENTGATSFHLRQLGKYGFVEEIAERNTSRERWWRARTQAWRFSVALGASPEAISAALLLRQRLLDEHAQRLSRYLQHESRLSPTWREAAVFTNHTVYVTPTELDRLSEQFLGLLADYARPDRAQRPRASRRVDVTIYGLPEANRPGPATPGRRSA